MRPAEIIEQGVDANGVKYYVHYIDSEPPIQPFNLKIELVDYLMAEPNFL